jgi:hypothetical protein
MASLQEQFKEYQADAPEKGALSFDEFAQQKADIGNEEAKKYIEKEKDIESVAQPGTSAAYLGSDPQIGDTFVRTSLDSYQVQDAANERLAKETLDLRDENKKLKIELGNLSKVVNPEDDNGKKTDKGGFSAFVSSVGDALTGVVSGVENKMEAIYDDPKKRRNFLQGLNTIIKSSGYTPISQAKSPVGMIAEGQKAGFMEDLVIRQKERGLDIERLKALKKEKRIADPKDKVIADLFKDYNDTFNKNKGSKLATERTYNELLKRKDYTPTGILEDLFAPLNEVAVDLGFGNFINDMRKKYAENPDAVPSEDEIVKFKSIIDSSSGTRILGRAKELYPVSNVDLQLLLKGAGSLKTNPNALKVLLAAERSLSLIEDEAYPIASKLAYPGGEETGSVGFQNEAAELAAQNLAVKFEKDVKDETLKELFGSTEKTPFRIIQAKLYQDLQADKSIPEISAFDKFIGAQAEKENEIDAIKDKYKTDDNT